MQQGLWGGAGLMVLLALGAGLADGARARRHDPDAVGWVPWTLVQVLALVAAMGFAIAAFHV